MAKVTPQEAAQTWADQLGSSTTKIQRGIERLTVSPTESAAKMQSKMLANLTAAINDGTWANNLRKVTLDQWKQRTIEKGLPRIASGAQASVGRMTDFMAKLLPYQDNALGAIKAMPSNTKADTKNRMNAWFDKMSAFKGK